MALILEVKAGPSAGRKIPLPEGRALLVGRATDRAQFAVPHDNQMSGVHFAVECGPNGCHLIDKKSTNGTYLNGAKIEEEMLLAHGDEIKSGQTIFLVRIVPDKPLPDAPATSQAIAQPSSAERREMPGISPPQVRPMAPPSSRPALQAPPDQQPAVSSKGLPSRGTEPPPRPGQTPALMIGGWAFHKIPEGWKIQEGIGIQRVVKDAFPASIVAIEEPLGPGLTLQHYVDAHTKMFREYLPDPKINLAVPPVIRGSVETVALEIQYSPKEGPSIFFRRDYARCGTILGVLTLTTLEKDLPSIRPIYDSVLTAISFSHKEQA
jgi:pSer/pThr/pTyr-binding forkhead associated (FHA) protein